MLSGFSLFDARQDNHVAALAWWTGYMLAELGCLELAGFFLHDSYRLSRLVLLASIGLDFDFFLELLFGFVGRDSGDGILVLGQDVVKVSRLFV